MNGKINAKSLIYFICIFYGSSVFAQFKIEGYILDSVNYEPAYANIVLKQKKDTYELVDYSFTDDKGYYTFEVEETGNYLVEVSALNYNSKSKRIEVLKLSQQLDFALSLRTFELNEVIVNTEREIQVLKDTIKIKAENYLNGTESTVEDLLQKIPGIQIDNQGTIKVGNQEIEKLMVDGDDLFEKGYKILSKNMPAYPIEEIEVLLNFSNNSFLKGIEESDKVALNLKLNEKSKRIWFGNIETSLGNDSFYQVKSNLMNFGKKNKYYFLTNLNSIGYDATGDIVNLVRPFRSNEPENIGDNQTVNSLLSLSPNQLNFNRSRTNFNNAELVSLNAIFNPTEKLKIKLLAFFNWDETEFFRNSIDAVDVSGTNFTNTEDYELRNEKKIAFGKLDLSYNLSKNQMLEATTKYNFGDFNDGSNLTFNAVSTNESLQHQNNLFDQKISYTNKFEDKKVFLLTGRFIDEKTPQTYRLDQFFYQDLFPENPDATKVSQFSENQMKFAGINAKLLVRKENGHLLELQLGNDFRKDKLSTTFSLLEDETLLEQPDGYQNQTRYQVNDLYFKSKYRLVVKDFGLVGKLDFHQLFNRLDNNNTSSNQSPFFINPSLGIDWEINDKNKILSTYSYNTTNAEILDVFSEFVLTGFRSFDKGTGRFNQLDASSVVFNYQLGNWSDKFFANTFILYSKNHDFFSTNTQVDQNFTQVEKILIQNREFINISSKLDYYFKSISSNLKLDLGYIQSEFKNIVNDSDFREVKSTNYTYGLEFRSGFQGIFNYHIGTKWITTEIQTLSVNEFTDNISFLDLSLIFKDRFDFQIQTERYFFGNLQTDNTYYFLDFNARYKLIESKLTLGLTGKNLFNTERFRNFSISDIGTSTTEYRLLPRIVLLKLEYRF